MSRMGLRFAATTCAFISLPSLGQSVQGQGVVDEVIVTARRTSETVRLGVFGDRSTMDTPASATGYTDALILDQAARSTSEVLANDPSIRVQSAGDGNYDYFSIRGFSVSASVFSLNGLYGVLPWNTLSPEPVERFAVIRGPATTFVGASPFDNPGGVVDILPKRAGEQPLTRVTALMDAGGQAGIHADVGHRFGSDGQWGVRVNAVYRDGELARDHQTEEVQLLSLGADYRGERTRVSLDAGYQDFRTGGTQFLYYIYEGTPVPRAPETDDNVSPSWASSVSSDAYVAARGEFDLSQNAMVYVTAGTRDHDSEILNPYSEILDGDGSLYVYPYEEAYLADTHWSAEAGVKFSLTTGSVEHDWVLSASGLSFDAGWLGTYSDGFTPLPEYESNLYAPVYPEAPDVSGGPTDGVVQIKNKLTGVTLLDTMAFDDGRYQLTLAVRSQRYEIERVYEPDNPYDDSAWSPSVALLAKVNEGLSVYANYFTGLSQGPFAPVGTENQNEAFPPGKSEQYEIGAKAVFGGLSTSVALFQITQEAGLTDPTTNVFGINGEQRHRGLEWTWAGEIQRGLRVLGGVNYIDAELTRTDGGAYDGNDVPGVPQLTANLSGEWDVGLGFTLTGRIIYTDEQYVFADNAQAIDDWTRLDLGARYATNVGDSGLTFRLNAINVTGEDYWASAKGFGLSLGSARSVVLSASVDF